MVWISLHRIVGGQWFDGSKDKYDIVVKGFIKECSLGYFMISYVYILDFFFFYDEGKEFIQIKGVLKSLWNCTIIRKNIVNYYG